MCVGYYSGKEGEDWVSECEDEAKVVLVSYSISKRDIRSTPRVKALGSVMASMWLIEQVNGAVCPVQDLDFCSF